MWGTRMICGRTDRWGLTRLARYSVLSHTTHSAHYPQPLGQEAKEAGFSNFYEITARESLDQVRIVFFEGIRRGLASGDHRGYRRMRSISMESPCLQETSPESDSPTISPRSKIIVSKHIMANIKRNLMSKEMVSRLFILRGSCLGPKQSVESIGDEDLCESQLRTRSNTFSVGRVTGLAETITTGQLLQSRYRKLSVFEPRSAST